MSGEQVQQQGQEARGVPAENVRMLLKMLGGDPVHCRACGAEIWFVKMPSGKAAPITAEALNHFSDCPQAARFRKPKGG